MSDTHRWLAAFLDLRGQLALVVGGGAVGHGKVRTLLRAGAQVRVVSPALDDALAALVREHALEHRARRFEAADLEGARVVVAATDDARVNAHVAQAAKAHGLAVNVADDPALSTFIMPAVVERGAIQVAISTGGASPALARRLAARVEAAIPEAYARLAELMAAHRDAAKRRFASPAERRAFWDAVLDGDIARLVLAGRHDEARALIEAALAPGPRLPPGA